jgi:very-short-patch-repair endonuclease
MPNVIRPASRPSSHRALVLAERASSMRRQPTTSERLLFDAVRGGRLGVAFKRQVPLLGRYIADLFVPSLGLVVEVDGGYHGRTTRHDERRDRALARAGYRVLRVEAELVMRDLPGAVAVIRKAIASR